jgi:hypothetical protein
MRSPGFYFTGRKRSETACTLLIGKQITNRAVCLGKDAVELEVTLDGEGKDRVFRVSMKWHAQVYSFFCLNPSIGIVP